jgi:hypothetical protein
LHRLWCAMASHHRCPLAPALTVAALVEFQNRPLGDEALTQHTLLAELPLPKACRGGRRLALPTCVHSHIGRVRWHPSLRHVAHLIASSNYRTKPLAWCPHATPMLQLPHCVAHAAHARLRYQELAATSCCPIHALCTPCCPIHPSCLHGR